jgi:hypothetical protein
MQRRKPLTRWDGSADLRVVALLVGGFMLVYECRIADVH